LFRCNETCKLKLSFHKTDVIAITDINMQCASIADQGTLPQWTNTSVLVVYD